MLIIGAGALAREMLQVLLWMQPDTDIALFDDVSADPPAELYARFPVLRGLDDARAHWRRAGPAFVVAVGQLTLW